MISIMKPLPQPLNQLHRRHLSTQTLQRGETLFVQDAATAGLYFLSAGTIDLTRSTATGHHVLIHRARSGDTFAEASLFSTHYHCTATASTEASVIACARMAEYRHDLPFNLWSLGRFGYSVFFEAGRAWSDEDSNPWLSNLGAGLVYSPSRSSSTNLVRLELAAPLNRDDDIERFQLFIGAESKF